MIEQAFHNQYGNGRAYSIIYLSHIGGLTYNGRVLVARGNPAVTQAEPFSNCKPLIVLLTIFSRAGIVGGWKIRGGS